MSRRKLRESIFLMLFRIEFNSRDEVADQIEDFLDDQTNSSEDNRQYITDKLNAILDSMEAIDEQISTICDGWNLNRIGKAELAILRLAVYEITKDEDIPTGVAINEAVELAKTYCSDDAPRFINGVLAKLA